MIGPWLIQYYEANPNLILGAGLAVVVGVYYITARIHARKAHSPPGPSSLPIIGSLFHYPTSYPWFKFTEWKEQYGTFDKL